jgi:MFS family permease
MEATAAVPSRARVLRAFQSRDFRLLWTGQAISLLGDTAFVVALGWRTFSLTHSARSLGFVLALQGAGLLSTVLVGGALADRYERRTLMLVSDAARFVIVGVLVVVDATGHLAIGNLCVIAFVEGLATGFFTPALGGMIPLVVEEPGLGSANALIGMARQGSLLVGPTLAGVLYGLSGSTVVFAFVLMAQWAPIQVLTPKLVRTHFHLGVGAYGVIFSMLGAGMIVGAVTFARLNPHRRRGLISYLIWIVNSLLVIVFALSPWYPLALAASFCRGICIGFAIAVWETMLMELVPQRMLSRVISLDWFGSFGLAPIGLLVAGAISSTAAPGTIIAAGACVSILIVAGGLLSRQIRTID